MSSPVASGSVGTWPVRRTFYVEYRYVDVLEHLNHAAYFGFMETLRCDYYLPLLPSPHPSSLDIIIAESSCRYLAPVLYGTEILGEVTVARPLGRTSFVLLYRFSQSSASNETKVVARGRSVIVCYDYTQGMKKEIPTERRHRLEADSIDPSTEGW